MSWVNMVSSQLGVLNEYEFVVVPEEGEVPYCGIKRERLGESQVHHTYLDREGMQMGRSIPIVPTDSPCMLGNQCP